MSTTQDLVRFGEALLRGEIIKRESRDVMFTSQRTRTGADSGYGLGWYVNTDARGRPYIWHGGRGVGGRAAIVIIPHVRLVVVMLSNIEGERLDEHARRIAAYFLESIEDSRGNSDSLRVSAPGRPAPPYAYQYAPAPGE